HIGVAPVLCGVGRRHSVRDPLSVGRELRIVHVLDAIHVADANGSFGDRTLCAANRSKSDNQYCGGGSKTHGRSPAAIGGRLEVWTARRPLSTVPRQPPSRRVAESPSQGVASGGVALSRQN